MNPISRRNLLAAGAAGGLLTAANAAAAQSGPVPQPQRPSRGGTDPGPRNLMRDRQNSDLLVPPSTDHGTLPNLRFSFSDSRQAVSHRDDEGGHLLRHPNAADDQLPILNTREPVARDLPDLARQLRIGLGHRLDAAARICGEYGAGRDCFDGVFGFGFGREPEESPGNIRSTIWRRPSDLITKPMAAPASTRYQALAA
jgi:hypothetical protein